MEYIKTEQQLGVGTIIFNRPAKRNAFNTKMYEEFCTALSEFQSNVEVKVIVLSGEGKDFCSGNEIDGFKLGDKVDPKLLTDRQKTASTHIGYLLAETKKPLIAKAQGRAIGFGATMLLHCDFVLIDESASLIFPFASLGIVPEVGSSQLLVERLGYLDAAKIILRDHVVSAQQAKALKLVSDIVEPDVLQREVTALASELSAKPYEALVACKSLLKRPFEPIEARIHEEFMMLAKQLNSEETQKIMAHLLNRSVAD